MQADADLVQAILFVSGEPVSVGDLCAWTGMNSRQVLAAVERLADKDRGVIARRYGDSVQLVTNPKYADVLRKIFSPEGDGKLSASLLETLSIVAYRQPVTRLEIEEIRGVRSSYAISTLLEKGLIARTGTRAVLGHPAEYGTTERFLQQFDLRSLEELPDVEPPLEEPPTLTV